jgi:uncharacterized protein (TIGR03437 family)
MKTAVGLFLLAGAVWAQPSVVPQSAFTCVANAGTPPVVRVEGFSEQVGDLTLDCTGGTPTPIGQNVPMYKVSVLLNTNATNRLIGGGYIDAFLLIDDPYPKSPIPSDATPPPNSPPINLCTQPPCVLPGTGGVGTYLGGPNVFQATVPATQPNVAVWDGIPIDPPGTTGHRIIRFVNIRANATQLGLSSTLIPTQIIGFVQITGSPFVTITNPQQTLAYIQQGLFVAGTSTSSFQQCNGVNQGAGTSGFNVTSSVKVNIREGFSQSFKRQGPGISTNGTTPPPKFSQNVPGFIYNTESSFYSLPEGLGSPANSGTRVLLTIPSIGNGTGNGPFILLPLTVPLINVSTNAPSTPPAPPTGVPAGIRTGFLSLLGTSDLLGDAGAFSPIPAIPGTLDGGPTAESQYFLGTGSLGSAAAVYEVVNSDPAAIESGTIPIGVAFIGGGSTPAPANFLVNVSLAPALPATTSTTSSSPIPRFVDTASSKRSAFTIYSCNVFSSALVFPFPAGASNLSFTAPAGSPNKMTSTYSLTTTGPPISGITTTLKLDNAPGANPNAWEREAAPAQQPWIVQSLSQSTTPADLTLTIQPQGLAPGTYTATITINTPGAATPSTQVPVRLTVAGTQPTISVAGVTNSASNKTTSVTPGMFVTIYGSNFGPATLNTTRFLENKGTLATSMSDTRVVFDGQYLAPMVYAAQGQISAIVPYEIAGQTSTQIVVEYKGLQSLPIIVPVTDAAPALFTADSSGSGPAAALNLDFSFNNSSNPVAQGSFIQLFGTGEGMTKPGGVTGGVNTNPSALPAPVLQVSAKVGGIEVTPVYFGGLFGQLNGFFQVNLPIPPGVGSGNVPVVVRVNGKESPPVTVSVK